MAAPIALIPDRAIGESARGLSDGLGFVHYASILANAARSTEGPFTIGIFGEWGTGKTSLMRLIHAELAKPEPTGAEQIIVPVWFNAWRYEKDEHPLVPLIGCIIEALDEASAVRQKAARAGEALVSALRAVAYAFSATSRVKIPGFAEIEASFVAKDLIDRREALRRDPLLDRSLYYGAFGTLDKVEHQAERDGLKVVVFIDDLDRCFPEQAIRLLESIKLVLGQQGFIFFLGVARRIIEGYVQHRYEHDYGIADFDGASYLDKIVQLPFSLPPARGRITEFCGHLLSSQPADLADQLRPVLPIAAAALGANPRAVIRFVNNLLIDSAINQVMAAASGEDQIPVQFFAITRCLQYGWQRYFEILIADPALALSVASWPDGVPPSTDTLSRSGRALAVALEDDARLRQLLTGEAGRAWLTDPMTRAASVEFLRMQRRIQPEPVRIAELGQDQMLVIDLIEADDPASKALAADLKPLLEFEYSQQRQSIVRSYDLLSYLNGAPVWPASALACVFVGVGLDQIELLAASGRESELLVVAPEGQYLDRDFRARARRIPRSSVFNAQSPAVGEELQSHILTRAVQHVLRSDT